MLQVQFFEPRYPFEVEESLGPQPLLQAGDDAVHAVTPSCKPLAQAVLLPLELPLELPLLLELLPPFELPPPELLLEPDPELDPAPELDELLDPADPELLLEPLPELELLDPELPPELVAPPELELELPDPELELLLVAPESLPPPLPPPSSPKPVLAAFEHPTEAASARKKPRGAVASVSAFMQISSPPIASGGAGPRNAPSR